MTNKVVKSKNRGEPTSDAGSHILTIITLTPYPSNLVQLNFIILRRLDTIKKIGIIKIIKIGIIKIKYKNWN